jgi:hypothetical protein
MAKTIGELVIEKSSARMENSPLLKSPRFVRIHVYSMSNPKMQFDISVPAHTVDRVVKTVPIAGKMLYNDPNYYHAGYAEPLCDMLEDAGIEYILHSDLSDDVVMEAAFA